MVQLLPERFEPDERAEPWIGLPSRVPERFHEPDEIERGGGGDVLRRKPFPDKVSSPVPSHVEGTRVLESGAAVVGPDRHVPETGDLFHQILHHFGVVFKHHRMRHGKIVAGMEAPHRMIDARAAQHRVALQEPVGDRPRLKADNPRRQAVFLRQRRVGSEIIQVRLQVIIVVRPLVQAACHKLIERRRIRIKAVEELPLRPPLERNVKGKPVHLDVGISHARHCPDMLFPVEFPDGAPPLRQK